MLDETFKAILKGDLINVKQLLKLGDSNSEQDGVIALAFVVKVKSAFKTNNL